MSDDDALQRKPGGHAHLRRAFLAGAAALSLLVTILAGGAMGVYFWTQNQIQYIPPTPGSSPGGDIDIGGPCLRHACNYLLLGSDSRAGLTKEEQQVFGDDEHIGGVFRSDTIIVVHVEPGEKEAVATVSTGSTRRSREASRAAARSWWPARSRRSPG
jgi:hypothetical protein